VRGYAKLSLTAFFWAGAFYAARYSLTVAPPIVVAFVRFAVAGTLLLAFVAIRGRLGEVTGRKRWIQVTLLGLTGICFYNLFFFTGLKLTSSINGSLIVGANPGITALLSSILKRERLGSRRWIGIIISFAGVLFVIARGSLDVIFHLDMNRGDILISGAATCWAVYSIVGKDVMRQISPLVGTAYASFIGALMLAPVAWLQITDLSWLGSGLFWISVLYMAVFASVIGYVWWYQGVQEIGASRAAVFINLVPVFVMLFSVFSGDLPNTAQLVGALLVLIGVYLTSSRTSMITPQEAG